MKDESLTVEVMVGISGVWLDILENLPRIVYIPQTSLSFAFSYSRAAYKSVLQRNVFTDLTSPKSDITACVARQDKREQFKHNLNFRGNTLQGMERVSNLFTNHLNSIYIHSPISIPNLSLRNEV